ncbi:MAG: hypothetical protein AAFX06_08940 [Planctomycetota bacterium]
MNDAKTPNEFELELPLDTVPRIVVWLAIALAILMTAASIAMAAEWTVWGFGKAALYLWSAAAFFLLAASQPTQVKLRAPDSCMVNCLAIALECIGFGLPIEELAAGIEFNRGVRGTSSDKVLTFLDERGFRRVQFEFQSESTLKSFLWLKRAPLILIVDQPYISSLFGFGWLFKPILSRFFPATSSAHAILVYGYDEATFQIFDPAVSTRHRVTHRWLRKHLREDAFSGQFGIMAIIGKWEQPLCQSPLDDDQGYTFTVGL